MTETIVKRSTDRTRAPNLADYEAFRRSFSWDEARGALDGLPGGRGLNMAHEAVDRHAAGARRDQVAIRWLGLDGTRRDLTFGDLARGSSRFANVLRGLGVAPGDRVYALTGRIPELYFAALGAWKAKAVLCTLFAAFGPEPIRARMAIGEARVLVTTEALYRKKIAGIRAALPKLEHVLIVGSHGVPDTRDLAPLMDAAADTSRSHRPTRRTWRSCIHERQTGTPKARCTCTAPSSRTTRRRSSRSISTPTTCTGAPPTRAG
jgi:acetyl-CoA synthetase